MSKKPTEGGGPKVAIRALNRESGPALKAALREIYGDAADDLTVKEVAERHPDLIARFDGERTVNGIPLSDEGMNEITHQLEVGTAVRDARVKLATKMGRKKRDVA
jgi:hypothetical protein